jgi:L-histidine N-alpha-methyltransferase
MTDGKVATQVVADPEVFEAERREVLEGLRRPEKRISSKYHYDERGSELFEQITRLEEYYPTRTETALLREWMPRWVADLGPSTMVELGAGNAEKSRIILDAMRDHGSAQAYVPVDVSTDFLRETSRRLSSEYPLLDVLPAIADITSPIPLSPDLPGPKWIAFLGSTLGNFEHDAAIKLLRHVIDVMGPGDEFLLGVDLRPGSHKSAERIELAYNDPHEVTAAFSLNVLSVLNAEFGSNFDPNGFRHRAHYDHAAGRIETHLDSLRDQLVVFPEGEEISFAAGEAVRTEVSCKYDRPTIEGLFAEVGLGVDRWVEDEHGFYALVLGSLTA